MSDDRRDRVFRIATGASLAVLLPGTVVGFEWARRAVGATWWDVGPSYLIVLMVPVVLSYVLGGYICRRMGIPLTHRRTERLVRGRQREGAGQRVHLQCTLPAAFVGVMLAAQVANVAGKLLDRSHLHPLWGWLATALFFTFIAWQLSFWWACTTLDVDEAGITRRVSLLRRKRLIPWSQIASCTIDTSTDAATGDSGSVTCTLRNSDGRVLLRARLPSESDEECARFLARIREQGLQTTPVELIAADAPEGTGTEPEAASVPAGTGTELQAEAEPVTGDARAQGTRARTP